MLNRPGILLSLISVPYIEKRETAGEYPIQFLFLSSRAAHSLDKPAGTIHRYRKLRKCTAEGGVHTKSVLKYFGADYGRRILRIRCLLFPAGTPRQAGKNFPGQAAGQLLFYFSTVRPFLPSLVLQRFSFLQQTVQTGRRFLQQGTK